MLLSEYELAGVTCTMLCLVNPLGHATSRALFVVLLSKQKKFSTVGSACVVFERKVYSAIAL